MLALLKGFGNHWALALELEDTDHWVLNGVPGELLSPHLGILLLTLALGFRVFHVGGGQMGTGQRGDTKKCNFTCKMRKLRCNL